MGASIADLMRSRLREISWQFIKIVVPGTYKPDARLWFRELTSPTRERVDHCVLVRFPRLRVRFPRWSVRFPRLRVGLVRLFSVNCPLKLTLNPLWLENEISFNRFSDPNVTEFVVDRQPIGLHLYAASQFRDNNGVCDYRKMPPTRATFARRCRTCNY